MYLIRCVLRLSLVTRHYPARFRQSKPLWISSVQKPRWNRDDRMLCD